MAVYDQIWVVLIYGFLGWCGEVAFAAARHGKFVNRGFLNGPICPIYGFGVLIVSAVLSPIADNWFLLFVGAVVLTTLLEYLTGLVLEQIFHRKWWDYSAVRFNLGGYVCLRFSLLWGVAASVVVKFVYPLTMRAVSLLPRVLDIVLLAVLSAVFLTDLVITLVSILGLPRRLRAINEAASALVKLSDEIGENVAATVFRAEDEQKRLAKKGAELREHLSGQKERLKSSVKSKREEARMEAQQMAEKYERLIGRGFTARRIGKAFPNLGAGKLFDMFSERRPRKK
ncbi:MAG: hypothetical protein ACI4IV_00725 [Acutalibacteraceae bacterium]